MNVQPQEQSRAFARASFGHALCAALLLSGCGGGGDGGSAAPSPPPPPPPPPPPATFTVGGTVAGLAGSGAVLQNNGGNNLAVTANGGFTFSTAIASGGNYVVTVLTQPATPSQTCVIANGAGTATANVTNIEVTCTNNTSSADTDGDGLTDAEETGIYRTSPTLADTDGDGYSDYRELRELGFDAAVNNYRYNPLIADLPKLKINIRTAPDIGYTYTDTTGSSSTDGTTRSQSNTVSNAVSVGGSVTVGVESQTTVETTVGLQPSASASQSFTASLETTVSFNATNTTENQTAYESMQQREQNQSITLDGGYVRVGVVLENAGHIPFTLQHISLSSTMATEGDDPYRPLATLDYSSSQAFSPTSLSAGQQTGNLIFARESLDVGSVRALLSSARSVTIDPAIYEVTDINGQPFAYQEAEVAARTAKILIDYGVARPVEIYQVATNSDPASPGRALNVLLSDFLRIPFTSDSGALASVRSVGTAPGRWAINSVRNNGTSVEHTLRDAVRAPYDLTGIDVRAGDEIALVYVVDTDGDGLGEREEIVHGTSLTNADTDGDGISDYDEIRTAWTVTAINALDPDRYPADVSSSPIAADYDRDTLPDMVEQSRGLDPYNADTDGDGIRDDVDTNNGNLPMTTNLKVELIGERMVRIGGTITARSPNIVATATIDWGDGSAPANYSSAGTNPTMTIVPLSHVYAAAGDYTITLDASDNAATAHTLRQTSQVELTSAARPLAGSFSYDQGWRITQHVREIVDLDQDGHADIVAIGFNSASTVEGSASGMGTSTRQLATEWLTAQYPNVAADPRSFVDFDGDGDLDIVGVRSATNEVRFGLNNGTTFDASVGWITGIGWTAARDSAFLADVDGNGFPDFVHARSAGNLTVYLHNGAALTHSNAIVRSQAWPAGATPDRSKFPISMADLDSDGCIDIVMFANDGAYYARSSCNGSFGNWTRFSAGMGYAAGSYRVPDHPRMVEDVTGDGRPDIIAFAGAIVFILPNTSTGATISFGGAETWNTSFTRTHGWTESDVVSGITRTGIYPRYLADVNADGYLDIVGYSSSGAAIGINQIPIDGTHAWSYGLVIAPAFAASAANWSATTGSTREYFPRKIGDVDNDGRIDFIGFDRTGVVYQRCPSVTQFN